MIAGRPSWPAPAIAFVLGVLSALGACTPPPGVVPGGPAPADTGTIPAALRGRWGLSPADCDGGAAAKGLLTIDATTLRFYESRGILVRVVEGGPTRIRGDFAFTGKGVAWRRGQILDAQDGGATLVRRETGPDATPGPLRYRACPAP